MQYRVRYEIWRVNANSVEEAKRYVVDVMTKHAAQNIRIEQFETKTSIPHQLLFGR
jgi:hypothetical protein